MATGAYGTSTVKRHRRSRAELEELDAALIEIVAEIQPATVRKTFYQAVVRGLVEKHEACGYRLVQRRLLLLREWWIIPYGWITDNARMVRGQTRYSNLDEFVEEIAGRYRKDYWQESNVRVEVWLEKDALAGVLYPTVVERHGLNLYVTRGFASVSYLHNAAEHIKVDGRPTFVYLLSDFDPSGLQIAETVGRELVDRAYPTEVEVERVAVTKEQIEELKLPTRPTKTTDTRARTFIAEHGTGSVELDALPPDVLRGLVDERMEQHMDPRRLALLKLAEQQEREGLAAFAGTWGEEA